jgi:hypothetical protein
MQVWDFQKIEAIGRRLATSKRATIEHKETVRFSPRKNTEVNPDWTAKGLSDLREWMLASQNTAKTICTWQATYIQCGACLLAWQDWCAANPIGDDLPGWIQAAQRIVTEKRWI